MEWMKNLTQTPIIPEAQRYFENCHASTLLKTGPEDFLCAYMAGEREGRPDMAIWLSACRKGVWQAPRRIQHRYLLPHWNPVLAARGEDIVLYYKVGGTVQNWYTMVSVSNDKGQSWSAPREAIPGDYSPRVCVRAKLLRASNGNLIGPCSAESGNLWDSFADISDDNGVSWHRHAIPIRHMRKDEQAGANRAILWQGLTEGALWETDLDTVMRWDGVIQPTFWESSPGHIHAMMRSTRGYIYRSDSNDYGRSWREAYPTALPNNNSGIDIVRLENGALILIYNPVRGNWNARSPISAAVSLDNGVHWRAPVHLESRPGEYAYPAVIAEGSRIYISYTFQRRNIVYATFEVVLP